MLGFNIILVLLSLPFGLTNFYNALGLTYKTKGKIDAVINNKPLDYYANISGK